MNRRAFFSRVLGGVATATIAPFLPAPANPYLTAQAVLNRLRCPQVGRELAFHQDAFAKVNDPELGISIRFIKQWDVQPNITRYDVLFGMKRDTPKTVRVLG